MKKVMWISLILLVAIVIAFVILDGSFLPRNYNKITNEKYIKALNTDIEKITAYAIGAPSGHNMQPWLVKIVGNNIIELYADMNKQLPVIDSDNNQLLMGQGAFIEKFKQGADAYGYQTSVEYDEIDLTSDLPLIARISIEKVNDVIADVISSGTIIASSNDEISDINESLNDVLSNYEGFHYEYIDADDDIVSLKDMLLDATITESMDAAATQELIDVFRFTEWQKNQYRYGLSLGGFPQIAKPFMQPIVKMSSKNIEAFGQSSIAMFEDRLKNDIGYILIKKEYPTALDFVCAGQIYQALIADMKGYSLCPAVQLLEKFEAMIELNKNFQEQYGSDGEVLLIISVQKQTSQSVSSNPRHLVEDIIID